MILAVASVMFECKFATSSDGLSILMLLIFKNVCLSILQIVHSSERLNAGLLVVLVRCRFHQQSSIVKRWLKFQPRFSSRLQTSHAHLPTQNIREKKMSLWTVFVFAFLVV